VVVVVVVALVTLQRSSNQVRDGKHQINSSKQKHKKEDHHLQ
jgi:hypothetical protein